MKFRNIALLYITLLIILTVKAVPQYDTNTQLLEDAHKCTGKVPKDNCLSEPGCCYFEYKEDTEQ